jgi:hypothetical protein
MLKKIILLTLVMTSVFTGGCETDDHRMVRIATESAERQAKQSEQMAKSHTELTEGARQLVESAGRSQESLVSVQHGLEVQQAEIGRQRDLLEKDRQVIATQRRTDPVIASAIGHAAVLLACVLPLVICWLVLRQPSATETDALVTQILVEEITAERPRLLPGSTAQPATQQTGLPSAD